MLKSAEAPQNANRIVRFQQLPGARTVKNLPAVQETGVQSLGWEDPWRREWQPILVLLPGESHEQRSLAGCSPWGLKESDTTERLTLPFSHFQQFHFWVKIPKNGKQVHLCLQQQYSQEPGRVHGWLCVVHPHSGAQRHHSATKDRHRASTFRRSQSNRIPWRQTESGRGQGLRGEGVCLKGTELQPHGAGALGADGGQGCTTTSSGHRGVT